MKKATTMLISFVILGIAATLVIVQQARAEGAAQNKIRTLGAMGYGLAISRSDTMDFEPIKIGVAAVDVATSGGNATTVRIGVLHFGDKNYRLKDAVIGNGTATANVYENGTQVGSISLNSYVKGNNEIWAGTMTLGGQPYNAYVIQAPSALKPAEKADNVKEYCENNPAKCKAVMKAVGGILCDPEREGTSCRDRIKTFCEQNPDDSRCKNLQLAYCVLHLNDANCRQAVIDKCKDNSTAAACDKLVNLYATNAQKMAGVAGALKNAPAWFNTVKSRIAGKTQAEINKEDDTPSAASAAASANSSGGN